jgi:hypothetical protein
VNHRRQPHRRLCCALWAALASAFLLAAFTSPAALAAASQAVLRQKLTADTPTVDNYYGARVVISGDTALIPCVSQAVADQSGTIHPGAGAVYVYVRTAGGWSKQAVLTDPTPADDDYFGQSVALSGDTAVVGATGVGKTGAAYVYSRTGTDWSLSTTLTALDGAAGDDFGCAVALSGDAILVTADRKAVGPGNTTADAGAAYVFRGAGASWTQEGELNAPSPAANDQFGFAAALSGDTALIGTPYRNNNTGAAYVFTRSGTDWPETKTLAAGDAAPNTWFGCSVALDGDTALIGATGATVGQTGAAYAFVGSGSSWAQQQEIADPASHAFGSAVALDGDTAVIGADTETVAGMPAGAPAGAAYVYLRKGTTWSPRGHVTDPDQAGSDLFGGCVAVSGTTMLVGSPDATVDDATSAGAAHAGAAYSYLLDSTRPVTTATGLSAAGFWHKTAVQVSLSAADNAGGAGLLGTHYTIDGGAQQAYVLPFTLGNGAHKVVYWSADLAGNIEIARVGYVNVDTRAPKVSAKALTVPAAKVKKGKWLNLRFTVGDSRPGCGKAGVTLTLVFKGKTLWTMTKTGLPTNKALTVSCRLKKTLAKGAYYVVYGATDAVGNRQAKATTVRLRIA